jgi:hypothetical protein
VEIELAKQLYDSEWSRRDQLAASIAVPISIVTALGGGLALLVKSFVFDDSFATDAFVVVGAAALCSLALAAYSLIRSYYGYEYQLIPSAVELEEYHRGLETYYTATGHPDETGLEFEHYLSDRYIEASEQNAHNNSSRSAHLYHTTRSVVLALVATSLLLVPWSVNTMGSEPSPQHVVIDQPGGGRHLTQSDKQPAQKPASEPKKPDAPPNRLVKEGAQPPPARTPSPSRPPRDR